MLQFEKEEQRSAKLTVHPLLADSQDGCEQHYPSLGPSEKELCLTSGWIYAGTYSGTLSAAFTALYQQPLF